MLHDEQSVAAGLLDSGEEGRKLEAVLAREGRGGPDRASGLVELADDAHGRDVRELFRSKPTFIIISNL